MADPRFRADIVPVFWSARDARDVLILTALPIGLPASTVAELPTISAERRDQAGDHCLLADAFTQLWLPIVPSPEAALGTVLPLDDAFPSRAHAALIFWRRMRGIAVPPPAFPTPQRRARLILGLRALDGRADGASQREIASALFGAARVPDGRAWKTHDLRSRTLRLLADASAMMRGGYRKLLR